MNSNNYITPLNAHPTINPFRPNLLYHPNNNLFHLFDTTLRHPGTKLYYTIPAHTHLSSTSHTPLPPSICLLFYLYPCVIQPESSPLPSLQRTSSPPPTLPYHDSLSHHRLKNQPLVQPQAQKHKSFNPAGPQAPSNYNSKPLTFERKATHPSQKRLS